jgi:hypothetical protein
MIKGLRSRVWGSRSDVTGLPLLLLLLHTAAAVKVDFVALRVK